MWNGDKEEKLKIFLGDGGGEVVPMEGLFCLVGSGVWSKGSKAHYHYLNSVLPPALENSCIGGKRFVSNPHKQSEKIHGFRFLIYLG